MDLSMWGGEVSRAHTAEVCGRLSLCTRAQSCIVDWLCVKRQEHTHVLELVLCSTFLGGFILTCVFFPLSICANQTTERIPAENKHRHMSHNTARKEKK